jgi:hypothetical protein
LLLATDLAVNTAWVPTMTPGPTQALAPIQQPSSNVTGFTIKSNAGDL